MNIVNKMVILNISILLIVLVQSSNCKYTKPFVESLQDGISDTNDLISLIDDAMFLNQSQNLSYLPKKISDELRANNLKIYSNMGEMFGVVQEVGMKRVYGNSNPEQSCKCLTDMSRCERNSECYFYCKHVFYSQHANNVCSYLPSPRQNKYSTKIFSNDDKAFNALNVNFVDKFYDTEDFSPETKNFALTRSGVCLYIINSYKSPTKLVVLQVNAFDNENFYILMNATSIKNICNGEKNIKDFATKIYNENVDQLIILPTNSTYYHTNEEDSFYVSVTTESGFEANFSTSTNHVDYSFTIRNNMLLPADIHTTRRGNLFGNTRTSKAYYKHDIKIFEVELRK